MIGSIELFQTRKESRKRACIRKDAKGHVVKRKYCAHRFHKKSLSLCSITI